MIQGIGCDIVKTARISACLKKEGARFIKRIFTEKEQARAQEIKDKQQQINYYAKRFAAKEAVVKALPEKEAKGISWKDIEVLNDQKGAPTVKLKKKLKKTLQIHLSLSDEQDYALAFCVISIK